MIDASAVTVLRELIFGRRSVREYTGEKLDAAAIRTLLEAAVRAPTAIHEEPWRFLIIQDPRALERLSERAKALFTEQAHCLHLDASQRSLEAFARPDLNVFYDAGTLIVICGESANPFLPADCWLAAQNLMLTAHAMGLGTCVIGSAVAALNEPKTKLELGIPADHMAIAPIIVGKPAAAGSASVRRSPEILGWHSHARA